MEKENELPGAGSQGVCDSTESYTVLGISSARPTEIAVPRAPGRWKLRGGDPRSLGTPGRPCSPPGSSHLPSASLSLTPRPPPRGGPESPDLARAPDPASPARRDRPSPDPAAGPPRTSRRAGGAPRSLAAAGSQSRPRSSRAGGYGGDSDPSGLHAPGGGGAGARVPALLAPSRAPGTQGRGRGGVTGRAPALRLPAQA